RLVDAMQGNLAERPDLVARGLAELSAQFARRAGDLDQGITRGRPHRASSSHSALGTSFRDQSAVLSQREEGEQTGYDSPGPRGSRTPKSESAVSSTMDEDSAPIGSRSHSPSSNHGAPSDA